MSNPFFDYLKEIFNKNGFRLYMIGSLSRDYLLKRPISDYDFVTDATPEEISNFLQVDSSFKKYGVVHAKINGQKVDIATLRKEAEYADFRHPQRIEFIKSVDEDYIRRDLTINAIYIDENYNVLDVSKQGYEDLCSKKIRFIGDPKKRIEEDPLRILRAYRFAKEYGFEIDEELRKVLKESLPLLEKLNIEKIKEENRKFQKISGGEDYEY